MAAAGETVIPAEYYQSKLRRKSHGRLYHSYRRTLYWQICDWYGHNTGRVVALVMGTPNIEHRTMVDRNSRISHLASQRPLICSSKLCNRPSRKRLDGGG